MLSHSLGAFAIEKATLGGRKLLDRPLEWRYTLEAKQYARTAGDLILLRPRALGSLSSALLETKEARRHPIEFDARELDTDVFEITLPAGYVVDDLPPAVNEDLGFVAYRSSTQIVDKRTLRYTRSLEVREVSVPAEKAPELKRLYRVIEGDERATAVFTRNATP
jgi:hypothetical protein